MVCNVAPVASLMTTWPGGEYWLPFSDVTVAVILVEVPTLVVLGALIVVVVPIAPTEMTKLLLETCAPFW